MYQTKRNKVAVTANRQKTMRKKNTLQKIQKPYIILEKYKKKVLGVKTNIYIIKFNHPYTCSKPLALSSKVYSVKNYVWKKVGVLDYLTKKKVLTRKIYKNDKIMDNLKNIMNPHEKYTYCLNKDTLILAETKNKSNNSLLKNYMSKHIMLCKDTEACASGEMVIYEDSLIFDNKSGSYAPSLQNLQNLKVALPFLNIKTVDFNNPTHEKYFKFF